ncbi:MAG: sugar ABC transporter permease [Clostridia bacterium]|nr:sugar ABC transporter permease [Clostridia bacterium]
MKKIREILLLFVFFAVSFALFIVLNFPSPFVAGSDIAFVGVANYLRLLLNDKIFFMAIINTIRKPFVSSVVLIPLACFILKNRIKFTRKSFYLTAFVTSFIISIVYLITNAALYNILGYIFFPMSISFLCLIIFWILELLTDLVKRFKRRR